MSEFDQELISTFSNSMDYVKKDKKEVLDMLIEKEIKFECLEISTKEVDGKYELIDKAKIVEECRKCDILILCFCYTRINEVNSFFRSTGLYTELFMTKDLSDMHGKLIKFDLPQGKYVREFTEKKPKNVLVLGPFGCGKTVFITQFMAIRISEMETNKKPFRVIIAADMPTEDSKLLRDMEAKNFGFLKVSHLHIYVLTK